MVDDSADPFGDLASLEQSGELTSITAHVAEVISQMAGTLNSLGANEDMDVEITYEFDLAVGNLLFFCLILLSFCNLCILQGVPACANLQVFWTELPRQARRQYVLLAHAACTYCHVLA